MLPLIILFTTTAAAQEPCCTGSGPVKPPNNTVAGCNAALTLAQGYPAAWSLTSACTTESTCTFVKCVVTGTVQSTDYIQSCMTPAIKQAIIDSNMANSRATLPTGATMVCSGAPRTSSACLFVLLLAVLHATTWELGFPNL